MLSELIKDKDERLAAANRPHWSHSRINRYLLCPEQYRLYYLENLRPRVPPATLVFGQIMHQALAHGFNQDANPVRVFEDTWKTLNGFNLRYSQKDSWEKLNATGVALLEKFICEELPKITAIKAVEERFELSVTTLDAPMVGIIDLVADLEGKPTVADFKTAGSSYDGSEVLLSDQLTAYKLAKPEVEQFALCVLVKTKEPKIEWHRSSRSAGHLSEYLTKVGYVSRQIVAGSFYKRPGTWCSWCDFLPICLGNRQQAKEKLVTIL